MGMKAIITMHLERPTRFKNSIITKKITGLKDEIHGLVNGFIYARANAENFIPVKEFVVEVFNTRNRVIERWKYKPTYSEGNV